MYYSGAWLLTDDWHRARKLTIGNALEHEISNVGTCDFASTLFIELPNTVFTCMWSIGEHRCAYECPIQFTLSDEACLSRGSRLTLPITIFIIFPRRRWTNVGLSPTSEREVFVKTTRRFSSADGNAQEKRFLYQKGYLMNASSLPARMARHRKPLPLLVSLLSPAVLHHRAR